MNNEIAINHRSIGVNFLENGGAEIVVWAPEAEKVTISMKNCGKIDLAKESVGYWSVRTNQIDTGDYYKILLDDEKEFPDPASLSQPEGVHGYSKAINLKKFDWTDSDWQNLPLSSYIIYELHVGTFTPEGTFKGIVDKLDYLVDLGITAIEIMPVAQFPGNRNWGYDGVFPFSVQNSYGGAEALQHLVNACHSKGIAVILDVVYNHLGPEGNYLGALGPYFTDKYNTPWGKALNFDDAWCDGVRKYFIENVLMWFRDFHIDGLRMDAIHAIKDLSPKHILQEMREYVNQLQNETNRDYYLIAEVDLNDPRFINPPQKNGYGLDAQWIDEFHHALRVATGNTKSGYYAEFEGVEHLAKSYKDAYVYDGVYSEHRKKTFGARASENPGQQFVVFSQNHDQVGNRMLGERTSQLVNFELRKLMAGAVMVSPYLPMLFMGEEYSETNPFLYFVSHTDQDLVEAVRKGRKAEFAEFNDEGEAPDPQSEETFKKSKLQWKLLDQDLHQKLFIYYKTLIKLRKENPVLKNLSRENLEVSHNTDKETILLHRWHQENHVVCLMNFSKAEQTFEPGIDQQLNKLFDSGDPQWKGPKEAPQTVSAHHSVTLQPESFLIYAYNV